MAVIASTVIIIFIIKGRGKERKIRSGKKEVTVKKNYGSRKDPHCGKKEEIGEGIEEGKLWFCSEPCQLYHKGVEKYKIIREFPKDERKS